MIEQRLNRFNRFSNHRRFFGERTRRLRIIDGIFDRVESILVERENFSFLFFFLPFIFFINDSTQIKILPFKIHPRSHSFRERSVARSRVEVNSQISMGGLWLVYNGSDDWRRGSDLKPRESFIRINSFYVYLNYNLKIYSSRKDGVVDIRCIVSSPLSLTATEEEIQLNFFRPLKPRTRIFVFHPPCFQSLFLR